MLDESNMWKQRHRHLALFWWHLATFSIVRARIERFRVNLDIYLPSSSNLDLDTGMVEFRHGRLNLVWTPHPAQFTSRSSGLRLSTTAPISGFRQAPINTCWQVSTALVAIDP